jgi:hypothetical protein
MNVFRRQNVNGALDAGADIFLVKEYHKYLSGNIYSQAANSLWALWARSRPSLDRAEDGAPTIG